MAYYNPYMLYKNSFLHYSNTKTVKDKDSGEYRDVYVNLLDKRFITTNNIDIIKQYFPRCIVKDLDDYYYIIYSLFSLDKNKYFENLMENSIIITIGDFISYIEERRF